MSEANKKILAKIGFVLDKDSDQYATKYFYRGMRLNRSLVDGASSGDLKRILIDRTIFDIERLKEKLLAGIEEAFK
jgi:hypothetical protein